MKKYKVLKAILPLIVIILFVAVAVWWQAAGNMATAADDPEDVLQASLGGNRSPAGQDPPVFPVATISTLNDKVASSISKGLQNLGAADPKMGDISGVPDIFPEEISLRDIHAAPGQMVRFSVCHPDATDYVWEYYDMKCREWLQAADEHTGEETAASGCVIAYADFEAPQNDQPELLIRCMYTAGTGEAVSEMAFLEALPQEIIQIALVDENVKADAGECLASCDVKVDVTYADNTSETLDGLYGLYFMESETETESSEFISSNGVLTERKVQTVQNYYRNYHMVSSGEYSVSLVYMPDTEYSPIQLSGTVTGTDKKPPEISMVDILDRKSIADQEGKISLIIMVAAEDNVTPYPELQYAVVQGGRGTAEDDIDIEKIAEDDWFDSPRFTVTLQEGTCFLCCRDQAGNISTYQLNPIEGSPVPAIEPEEPENDNDMQAPVIRNIYVEED